MTAGRLDALCPRDDAGPSGGGDAGVVPDGLTPPEEATHLRQAEGEAGMTDTGDALAPGTRLDEFEIQRVLGSGGFGVTYLARDLRLDRLVAVKEYLPLMFGTRRRDGTVGPKSGTDAGEDYRWGLSRFLKEGQKLAQCDHPHVVKVYRDLEAWGTAYLVMEYVEGPDGRAQSLKDELVAAGTLPVSRVRAILDALTSGLAVVHAAGLVHRDIKPANVMLRPDGSPVLIDFGAARPVVTRQTESYLIATDGYAAWEQYVGDRSGQGPWTDIYALGAVAYEALSGEVPAKATERVEKDPVRPLSEVAVQPVSGGLAAAIDAALRVFRKDRPQSLEAWRKLLEEEEVGGGGSARRWWMVGAAAALLAGVVLVAARGVPWNGTVPEEVGAAVTPSRVEEIVQPEALLPVDPSEEPEVPARPPEASPSPATVEEALGLDRADRRLIQEGLLAAGFDPGAADGQFGAGTRAALREWQAVRQAAETGYLDAASASALRSTAEGAARVAAQRQAELAAEAQRQAEREAAARRRPGYVFRDCDECPEMVVMAAGRLALGRYEVTVGEYRAFASATGGGAGDCFGYSWEDPGFSQTDRHPVACVSWDDTQEYLSWLSRRTGATYRLPTETEWERAAAGSQPGCDRLGRGTRPDGTCPVGSYGSNTAGLSDMVGNLWEWTSDCREGDCRVVHGGSWFFIAEYLRPDARVRVTAGDRNFDRGFRVSRTLD